METPSSLGKTILLEPDQLTRFALQALLGHAGMPVDHAGDDPETVLQFCRELRVGVLITELTLPDTSFPRFARQTLRERPHLRIIVLTGEEDPALLREAVGVGACAVLSKYADPSAIAGRVGSARRGGLILDEVTMPLVLGDLPHPEQPPALSTRERQILALIGDGLTMLAAARELGLAQSTVKTHAAKAAARLGAESSQEAARVARRLGII